MTRRGACSTAWLYAALLWFVLALVVGCTTVDPDVASALAAYDRAEAMGLVAPRIERPYARINDGGPWMRWRGVEIAR